MTTSYPNRITTPKCGFPPEIIKERRHSVFEPIGSAARGSGATAVTVQHNCFHVDNLLRLHLNQRVYVISADGGRPRQVATEAGGDYEEYDANWSPDGQSLIFSRPGVGIERVNLRTNEMSLVPGSEQFVSTRWSPSGRYLDALTADWQTLMLFDFSTGKWTKFAQGPANWHSWSHGEKYIYFDDAWSKYPRLDQSCVA
jgi:hypothetical protein